MLAMCHRVRNVTFSINAPLCACPYSNVPCYEAFMSDMLLLLNSKLMNWFST